MKIRNIIAALMILYSGLFLSAEAYPPEGWSSDLLSAIRESEESGKDILLNFTGSDWCVWCHRLMDEIFETEEFLSYAEENLILVFLDYPKGIKLSEETQKQNQLMMSLFGVQGFPSIWLMDSEQVPVLQTGYQQGGASAFIQTLEQKRIVLDESKRKEFQSIVRNGIKDNLGSW